MPATLAAHIYTTTGRPELPLQNPVDATSPSVRVQNSKIRSKDSITTTTRNTDMSRALALAAVLLSAAANAFGVGSNIGGVPVDTAPDATA
ncbi:hypothetical protein E2562_024904 [Oryza meyeriana var. granulata]|uniref:Uncharacterized protein n=1 Tax=Oryza meyeriana var. granulata TaxID=110450 RepID=A0A6G1DMG9_9ORYZ|nr:hypothetical protein E2562_024904 [Oryza meyeriana var. granulata]